MAYRVDYLDIIFIFSLLPFLLSVNTQARGKQFRVSQSAFRETIVGCPRPLSSAFSYTAGGVIFKYFLPAFLLSGVACCRRHIE
jgi:hypothetical protein